MKQGQAPRGFYATSAGTTVSSKSVLMEPSYRRFWLARTCSTLSFQMAAVAFSWQIYDLTHSTFALGIFGIVQFLPMLLLNLLSGHLSDRYSRSTIISVSQLCQAITLMLVTVSSNLHILTPLGLYCTAATLGMSRAFEGPALQAIVSDLVETPLVPQAIAWSASANQGATIIGPALGGVLYGIETYVPYLISSILFCIAALFSSGIKPTIIPRASVPRTKNSTWSGIHYIQRHKTILGAISLDFFVVLLGGATALFPAYARDVLHTGPSGLGLLRLSPATGGLIASLYFAHRPLQRRAGLVMFYAMTAFGAATILFALSRNLWLSMSILIIIGAADATSVVIRASIVQLKTFSDMRGRVSAVNSLFIGTSYQIGAFESGLTASWWGLVPATILGGAGSIIVALIWMALFPELRRLECVYKEELKPHTNVSK